MKSSELSLKEIVFISGLRHDANNQIGILFDQREQVPWGPSNPFYEDSIVETKAEIDFEGNREDRRRSSHETWMTDRLDKGWTYGQVRDDVKKTNPALVPYDKRAIVDVMKGSANDKALELGLALIRQKRELERAIAA